MSTTGEARRPDAASLIAAILDQERLGHDTGITAPIGRIRERIDEFAEVSFAGLYERAPQLRAVLGDPDLARRNDRRNDCPDDHLIARLSENVVTSSAAIAS